MATQYTSRFGFMKDELILRGMDEDIYSVSTTRTGSGRTHFQVRVGDSVTDRNTAEKSVEVNKMEKRSGKSWRKEREEKERKRSYKTNDSFKETEEKDSKEDAAAEAELLLKQKQEEEARKIEEQQRLQKEAEEAVAKAKQEEEEKTKQENKEFLEAYIVEAQERLEKKKELRNQNLLAAKERPELNTAKLDSNLKKNTAFIKKMKNLTESQHDSLAKELQLLNLSKYVSEVAGAVVEAKLKMADIPTVVHLCSLLHQRYHDFAQALVDNWQKVLVPKKDEKVSMNMSKLRVDLRLYAELIAAGVIGPKEGLPLLGNVLTTLVSSDKEGHQNISVLLTFCKHCGEDYMGLLPRKFRILSEEFKRDVPKSDFLLAERQKKLRGMLKEYYTSLTKHLIHDKKELFHVEQVNRRLLQTRGELNPERVQMLENMSTNHTKLLANTQQMAELLDEEMPNLPADKIVGEEGMGEGVLGEGGDLPDGGTAVLWEDDDTRAFYENLPQLKALIPSILYSDSEKPTEKPAVETPATEDCEEGMDDDDDGSPEDDTEEVLPPELPPEDEPEDSLTTGPTSNKVLLEGFLSALPNCINRDLIDSAAMEFCLKLNTKPSRKKLVRALFLVPRTRLDLLPFYSRLVSTLQPLMPDLATDLVNMLRQDFKYQVRKKDQINIESKIKVVRFIGELVKFRVFPRSEALTCLRMLLMDFNHHHIEMGCNLLETCGRFLYRTPDSHHRTKIFLEQMMRKKTVKAFDPRYNTMIENAYFYVNPPDSGPDSSFVPLTPIQQYVRKLLYNDLSKANTEKILRQLRKMHWDDPEASQYMISCLIKVHNAKFYNIRCIANVVAGLISHHDWVGPAVVDGILEDIRLGMEVNHPKFNQRRIASAKYLGELYNYRVIESTIIFKVLYSFISFGVTFSPLEVSEYDPPENTFRLRLVTTLLETCGQFFSSGSSKKRLDCFLVYFQHYYQYKKCSSVWNENNEWPWQLDHIIKDAMNSVRPKLTICKDLEEAQQAVRTLNQQILAKAIEQAPNLKEYLQPDEGGLNTIAEEGDGLNGSVMESDLLDMEEEDDELMEITEGDDDWSEAHGESLTPSQHSQPPTNATSQSQEEEILLTGEGDDEVDELEHDGDEMLQVDPELSIKTHTCQEDDDFMSAFDRMCSDSVLERSREPVKHTPVDISVPVHIKSTNKKTYEQLLCENSEEETKPVVNFVLLMRQGNKLQYSNVEMPVNSELVSKLRTREVQERVEREKVKRMTLEINERQEEEEQQEIIAQQTRPTTMNFNRDRRPKYQHPKGAPDADLIFGPKKIIR